LTDDEERLAALWAQPLDDATDGASTDDRIAALFSLPDVATPPRG